MIWTHDNILKTIAKRNSASRWGIGTASQYVSEMAQCLTGGGICPAKVFGSADAESWKKELDAAASRLTYCDDGMADTDYMQKSIRDGAGITPGAILEYDAVLSTTRKDRDGDILESGGLEIDTKMSLLWQHIQVSPIGKHVSVLKQTDSLVLCRFAIADTELGRDAAVLTRFGALRKSHGFKPTEFEPVEVIKSADGKDLVRGWHVKRAAVLEGSLVSIPSNSDGNVLRTYEKEFDGICTAFSRNELKNDLVKSWAKGFFDKRTVQSTGFTLTTKSAVDATKQHLLDAARREIESESAAGVKGMDGEKKRKCSKCGKSSTVTDGKYSECGHMADEDEKSAVVQPKNLATPLQTKDLWSAMDSPFLPGSFEAIEYQLNRTADVYLQGKGLVTANDDGYASTVGTFADYAVVCYRKYGRPGSRTCYRIGWKTNESGMAMWDGDPTEVKIDVSVMEKMATHLQAKSARMVADGPTGESTGGSEQSLDSLARMLAAKSFAADGDDGVRALEIAADAAVALKRQREIGELNSLLN